MYYHQRYSKLRDMSLHDMDRLRATNKRAVLKLLTVGHRQRQALTTTANKVTNLEFVSRQLDGYYNDAGAYPLLNGVLV